MAEDRTALDPTVDVSYKAGQTPLEKTDDIGPVMPPLHSTKQQQLQYDHDVAHLLQLIPGQPHLRQPIPTQQQQPRQQQEPPRGELVKRKLRANEDGNSARPVAADAHVHTKAAASDNDDEGGGGGTGDCGRPRKSPSEMVTSTSGKSF
ncbi:Protein PLK-3 [Anopheles sinensis]|uniref:Protein PLK-3 n=1 Tax=Anopheles sinensis TaxID=74873 RepID=A0A084VJE5_ANOSI|nr:Protein PLK-3 [Anopheles sinensis]